MPRDLEIDEINKIKILQRLKKIEGQIRGIQGMILDDRSCEEILMQISAVKSALHRTNQVILKAKVNTCFQYSEEINFSQFNFDEIIELIVKFLR